MAIDKIFDGAVDGIADNLFNSVSNSVSEIKAMQQRKAAENVQLVVQALKKIDADIREKYDGVTETFDKRIASIKDGRDGKDGKNGLDGVNGKDGRDGKDGRNGRDGLTGPRGFDGPKGIDGKDGQDGEDGVSVTDAHIDFDGSLIISLSSGRVINVGEVVAADIAEKIKVITNGGGTSQPVLDQLASLQAQIDLIASALVYKGTWNASTNTPALVSSVGTANSFYIVSVAGTTNLNGTSNWGVGDWAVFNGSVWQRVEGGAVGNFTDLTVSGTTTLSNLTASTALALNASKEVVSVTNTGTGNNVLATSPTLVTPALGTPSSATLTNATGLPLSSGVTGTLPILNGGTGQTTANAAFNALAPSQASNSGKYLTTNGTDTSWATLSGLGTVTSVSGTGTVNGLTLTGTVTTSGSLTLGGTLSGISNAALTNSSITINGTATSLGGSINVGTVTSVGATVPSFLSITGSPITSSGTLAISLSGTALPTTSGGTGLTSFTANGVLYASSTSALTTSSALIFDGANIGLGVALSSWGTPYKVIQLGDSTSSGAIYQSTSGGTLSISSNEYISATGARYINTAPANRFLVGNGVHQWFTAASGTAGTLISYTQAMLLDASGNLNIASLTASKAVFTDASKNLTSTGTLGIDQGGTGTTTPALVAGTNITITGSWPNQTINSSNTGGTVTSVSGTGTVSGISLSGTVTSSGNLTLGGALDLSAYSGAGAFTTLSASSTVTLSGGTANGVAYLNGSKVVTSGSALTFDGTNFGVGTSSAGGQLDVYTSTYKRMLITYPSLYVTRMQLGSFGYIESDAGNDYYKINGGTSSSANLRFDVYNTEGMRLTSTGLGIGTSSPSGKLDVYVSRTDGTNTNAMFLSDSATGIATVGFGTRIIGQSNAGGVKSAVGFENGGDGTNNQSQLAFYTQNAANALTRQMTISSIGNVGIGTSSPAEKLTVVGNIRLNGNSLLIFQQNSGVAAGTVSFRNSSGTQKAAVASYYNVADEGALEFVGPTGSTNMLLNSSGNLGLGVTPSAWGGTSKALQIKNYLALWQGTSGATQLGFGLYESSANAYTYLTTGDAPTMYRQLSGVHYWFTAPSGTAGNVITFTQAMTLDASGNLLVGTTSSGGVGLTCFPAGYIRANTSGTTLGQYQYSSSMMGTITTDGANIAYNANNALVFGSGGTTERARIDSSGNLLVGTTNTNPVGADVNGFAVLPNGRTTISRMGGEVFALNRGTDDGTLMSFAQAGSTEGSISVSGTTVSYNGGHLSRWAQTTTAKDDSLVKGTVLSNLDEMNVYTKDGQLVDNEQLNKVKVSDVEGDANVAGVFVNWSHDEDHNVDEINMAMTGDMIIRIAQGTTVVRGDLLMSAGNGTAKPQGDDIVRSKTIAKVTSNHVTCTYADGSYCVPCVLMAC